MANFDEQSAFEREKYVRAYESPKYARNAGRQALKNASDIEQVAAHAGVKTAVDFGCGNGDIVTILRPLDIHVHLIDFMGKEYLGTAAQQALGEGTAEYTQASLWDPSLKAGLRPAELGICTDVMEHIPEDRVDTVLRLIWDKVPLCFFRIALYGDSDKKIAKHGGPLHVTVRDHEWWIARLEAQGLRFEGWTLEQSVKTPSKRVLVGWTGKI